MSVPPSRNAVPLAAPTTDGKVYPTKTRDRQKCLSHASTTLRSSLPSGEFAEPAVAAGLLLGEPRLGPELRPRRGGVRPRLRAPADRDQALGQLFLDKTVGLVLP